MNGKESQIVPSLEYLLSCSRHEWRQIVRAKATLENVYLLLRTSNPILDSLGAKEVLDSADRKMVRGLVRLMLQTESRLLAHFPDVQFEKKRGA